MAFITIIENDLYKSYELFKRITTIGSSKEADIKINSLAPIAAYITQNNSVFTLILEDKNAKLLHKQKSIKSIYLSQKEEELILNDITLIFTKEDYDTSTVILPGDSRFDRTGIPHTEETKQLMRRPRSEETKKRMRKPRSEEAKKIGRAHV